MAESHHCARCDMQFVRHGDYNKHQKIHDRPYQCKICSRSFALETDRKRHRKLHQGSPKIQCPLSPCKFRGTNREDYFWKHLKQKHGDNIASRDALRRLYNEAKEKQTLSRTAEQNLRLLEAVSQGDDVQVTELISEGVNINTEDADQRMPLSLAAQAGHEINVKILLKMGADVNRLPKDVNRLRKEWHTPLVRAVDRSHEGIVRILLENGAEVNPHLQDYPGNTPLHVACDRVASSSGSQTVNGAIVRLLLQAGANIEARNSHGMTPLSYAVGRRHWSTPPVPPWYFFKEGVKLLLEAGAMISLEDWEHLPADLQNQYASQRNVV